MGLDKHEVDRQTRQARLELYFRMCSDLHRMMFPDERERDELAFAGATRNLLSSQAVSGAGFDSLDPAHMTADIYGEIEARRIQGKYPGRDGRPIIQAYFGQRQPDTHVLYEVVPEAMEFNISAHAVETEDSKPGARAYKQDGYSWSLVAFGGEPLTRVGTGGTYESSRDIAQWLQRLKLKENLEAVFRGA